MLVRFECGCVGLPPRELGKKAKALVFTVCDADADSREYGLTYRAYMGEKSYTPLDPLEEEQLVNAVHGLVSQGYMLRDTRQNIQASLTALEI